MLMLFKKLFKLTKFRIFFIVCLFVFIGVLKIFTLQNMLTGEVYKNSLFQQYHFQYQHWYDNWNTRNNQLHWVYYLFLHIVSAYVMVGVFSFISNRLRGKE